MELRRLSIYFALLVLAAVSQCSEARHSLQRVRRSSDDSDFDGMINDEGDEDGAQNDDGGNDVDEPEDPVYKITSQPETYHLLVGGKVRLSCNLHPKDDYAVVSWTKGESEKLIFGKSKVFLDKVPPKYPGNKFYIDQPSYDLIIQDVNFEDTGRYTCQVEQKEKVSLTHTVFVEEPVSIQSFTASNTSPPEGSDVLFTCNTRGTPKPSIIWSRQKKNSPNTEALPKTNNEFTDSTFLMRNVAIEDSGTYFCYAVNTIGTNTTRSATSTVVITVHGKPRLHVHRPVINSDIGIEAELKCFSRDGPHRITWFKNSEVLSNVPNKYLIRRNETADGSESTLLVIPSSDDDFGVFTCEAVNSYGTHSKSVELVQRPVIEQFYSEGPKLSWTVHSHQPLEEFEINLGQIDGGGEWRSYNVILPEQTTNVTELRHTYDLSYELKDDKLSGKYQATVKVRNNKDWSLPSDPIIVEIVLSSPGSSYLVQPTVFLNAIMMYLLVRMM